MGQSVRGTGMDKGPHSGDGAQTPGPGGPEVTPNPFPKSGNGTFEMGATTGSRTRRHLSAVDPLKLLRGRETTGPQLIEVAPSPPPPPQVESCVMAVQQHALAAHQADRGQQKTPGAFLGDCLPGARPLHA